MENNLQQQMEELRKMQSALEAKIHALSTNASNVSVAEAKRQRDDSSSGSSDSSSANAGAESPEEKRARVQEVTRRANKEEAAESTVDKGRLTKEQMEKELDAYRHENGFTFRVARPARIVACKETGEKWKGLTKIERLDLCCTARTYDPPCLAKRIIDRNPETGRIIEVRSVGEHIDHGRKRAARADCDVRRRAKQLVHDNGRPADIELVLEGEAEKETPGMPLLATRTMSQRQITQLRHYENHKINPYPAQQVLANVSARFGSHLLTSNFDPVRFIYMSQWQRTYASEQKAKVVLLDTTFDCIEEYKLTTLLVRHHKYRLVYFPIAFFIHSITTGREYERFLQEVYRDGGLNPSHVLRDFAHELRNAITAVWPGAANLGDLYHFINDNRKWLTAHQVAEKELILRDLREIAVEREPAAFGQKYRDWQARYRGCADYLAYFSRTWANRREEWSLGCRDRECPSGDQALEGYHLRLQKTIFKGVAKTDFLNAITCLDKEIQHWEKVIRSPELLERLHKDKERRAATRVLTVVEQTSLDDDLQKLVDEVAATPSPPSGATTPPAPKVGAAAQATADDAAGAAGAAPDPLLEAQPDGALVDEGGDDEEADGAGEEARNDVVDLSSSAVPSLLRHQRFCRSCKASRTINQKCTHRVCATCCEKLFGDCGIKAHNTRRLGKALAPIIADIKKAIEGDKSVSVWLKYATPTAIVPRWYEAHDIAWHPARPKSCLIMKHNSVTQGKVVDMTFKLSRLHAISFTQPKDL